jgi:glycine oxidase
MAEHPDVLILGGGVIGLTTAWFLTEAGLRVIVVDQGDLGQQASWAGAGILSPVRPAHTDTPLKRLHALGVSMYPELSRRLHELTGIDNGYFVCGGLELFLNADDRSSDEWRGEGIAFEELTGEEARRRQPGLASDVQRAYYLPELAQIRNPRHIKALMAVCTGGGAQLRPNCPARRLQMRGRRIEAVETDQGPLVAGRYLIATGAWTDRLLEPLGWHPNIRPVRGQIALLNAGIDGIRPLLLYGKRYMVPRGDGRVLVGSTEEDAGFDARPTAGAIAGLLEFAEKMLPSLASATIERCWAGLRPGSPDGKPYLGAVPAVDNLFVAAGHFRSGIQQAPATALVMKQLILGEKPTLALDDFRLDRPFRS